MDPIQEHHIFPQNFRDEFKSLGIDVDDYVIDVSRTHHLQGIHGKGMNGQYPGKFNDIWDNFFYGPNANPSDVGAWDLFDSVKKSYGLEGQMHRYSH